MDLQRSAQRIVTGLALAGILAATLAPAAEAGRRNHRYKERGHDRMVRYKRPHHGSGSTYVVRRSHAGPVIAGFIGGLFLGATLANGAPAGYSYYDPYCRERFASLDGYHSHLRRHRHPKVVRVVEVHRSTRYIERDGYHDDYGDNYDHGRDYNPDYDRDYREADWDERGRDRDRERCDD